MTNTPDTLREIDLVRASHVTKQSSDVAEASVLSQLAERCENATGHDWELDVAITIATCVVDSSIDPRFVENMRPDPYDEGWVLYEYKNEKYTDCAKSFTASIDDALKLVPTSLRNSTFLQTSEPAKAGFERDGNFTYFEAATPALAICAAALKARAALLLARGDAA